MTPIEPHRTPGIPWWGVGSIFLALLVVALLGSPATADVALIASSPESGERVTARNDLDVTLEFSESVNPKFVKLVATDPKGKSVLRGDFTVDGNTLHQRVDAREVGTYKISYRVISADGHPVTGTISFVTVSALPESAPTAAATPPGESAGDVEIQDESAGFTGWLLVGLGLTVATVLGIGVRAAIRRHGDDGRTASP